MSNRPPDPAEFLPLSEAVFHILLTLAGGSLHGYGIMREVEARTGGTVRLGPGTLYGAIKRLRNKGIVEETEQVSSAEDDERRKHYHLTAFGRSVAVAETKRLEQLLEAAHRQNLLPRRGTT